MSSLLFENPYLIGVIGILITGMSVFGWLQTGSAWAARMSIAMVALTAFLIWVNLWIVTDRESIREMLAVAASEVENNQLDRLRARIHPEATERVHQSMAQLPSFKFSMAKITQVHGIELKEAAGRKIAYVRMNVLAEAESNEKSASGMRGKLAAWVQLELEQQNGKWNVIDCEQQGPQHELLRHSE